MSFRKYFKNTAWLFLEKVLRVLVTLTVWAWIIRYLGPEQFGMFSYALSFVFLFGMLADLGLETVLVKDLLDRHGQHAPTMGSAFVLRIAGAAAAYILIAMSFYFWAQTPLLMLIIAIIALRLFFAAFNNIDSFFQSEVASKYSVFSQLMSLFLTCILSPLFILSHKPLLYFVWLVVLEAVVAAAGFVFFYRRWHAGRWAFDGAVARDLLSRSWPLVVSGFAIAVYMRIDQVMIKHMLGNAAVGQYAVAVRVSEAFYFIPMVVTASLFPAIVKAKAEGRQVYERRLTALNSLLIWISLGLVAVFGIWGRTIIEVFFGPAYLPAAGVLMLNIWASVFVFLGVLRSKWAVNENAQNWVCAYTVLGALANVFLNLFWIPLWGIRGAAMATVVSYFIAAVFSNLLHPKTRPMFFLQLRAFNPLYAIRYR